ncbi:MAG TPA: hypothetical protein VE076_07290 [Nitrososphaeraceae archaeon]|nr:hypothetical protein [Nitrososphaeraceae archaeon]
MQKAKSLDSTIDHEKKYIKCGKTGVIYSKQHYTMLATLDLKKSSQFVL